MTPDGPHVLAFVRTPWLPTQPPHDAQRAIPQPALAGAIAAVRLHETPSPDRPVGQALADVLASLDAPLPSVGRVRVVTLRDHDRAPLDRVVLARWTTDTLDIMPHGGLAVIDALLAALGRLGTSVATRPRAVPWHAHWPQAQSPIDALVLDALCAVSSPRAIPLLLDQPRRWRERGVTAPSDLHARATHSPGQCAAQGELDRVRARLLTPPLVVALGATNIGKSSLLNALAGRTHAIVADEPGTTRDHIGVDIELDGVVVRYVDTPGVRPSNDATPGIEREALDAALMVARHADLVLYCADAAHPDIPAPLAAFRDARAQHSLAHLDVLLRCDVRAGVPADHVPAAPGELRVSAHTGEGLVDLALAIRRALVPDAALEDPSPWAFWDARPIARAPHSP
jgi:tRNA U34 5-carboxymethylaminomethyl modifying GTPase MnmE/TrmE